MKIEYCICDGCYKEVDESKYDILFCQRLRAGEVEGWVLNFTHKYVEKFDIEGKSFGEKFHFDDVEKFNSHIMYLINRKAYGYIDVRVRGHRDGQRVDVSKHIKNDRSKECSDKKRYITEVIDLYFSDVSLLKNKVGEEEKVDGSVTQDQAKIIEDMSKRIDNMSQLYNDTMSQVHSDKISNISSKVAKKKEKRFLGIL